MALNSDTDTDTDTDYSPPSPYVTTEMLVTDRVERELRQEVKRLQGKSGAMLPSQSDIATHHRTSLRAVRDAMGRLKRDKLIRTIRGKGTFILEEPKKLNNVLLIANEPYYDFQNLCVRIFSKLLNKQHSSANLVFSQNPAGEWDEILQHRDNVCGAIVISKYSRDMLCYLARRSDIPIVCISDLAEPHRGPAVCDTVLPRWWALGYRCVEYLVRQGHERIALHSWELNKSNGQEVLRGYYDALHAHGLDSDPDYILDNPVDSYDENPAEWHAAGEEARKRLLRWADSKDAPTALVHGASHELPLRDMLEHTLKNHFAPDAVVGYIYKEQLPLGYMGRTDMNLVCASLEGVAQRALELLHRPRTKESPCIQESREEIFLCERRDGVWKRESFPG